MLQTLSRHLERQSRAQGPRAAALLAARATGHAAAAAAVGASKPADPASTSGPLASSNNRIVLAAKSEQRRGLSSHKAHGDETGQGGDGRSPQGDSHLHVQLEPLDAPNEGIFALSLTREEARNAVGRQMLRELGEALRNLAQERTTRCVVLRSSLPGVFCAGADLKERAGMSQEETAQFVADLRAALSSLEALPMPTIAAVDGFALGGGAELALACDLRVCGNAAQFAFPETRLGIIPGAGGTQRLPRVVGRARAKELIFTGRRVDAHEALRMGLADHYAEGEGACEAAALALAREVALAGPVALRMAKAAISLGADADLHTGLRIEEACYAQVLPTHDRIEGLTAFAEKRQPVFTGA